MYVPVKARLFKDIWHERDFANLEWIYSRIIIDNLSSGTSQILFIRFLKFYFKSVNAFIVRLLLLLILSLVLSTRQLYSHLSPKFQRSEFYFILIYPK